MRPLVSRRAERAFVNAWRRQGTQKAAPDFWARETASRREGEEENLSLAGGCNRVVERKERLYGEKTWRTEREMCPAEM